MSTNATITIKTDDPKTPFRSISLHWDGYPEHVLPILEEHYNSQESAEELVGPGNLSVLAPQCVSPRSWHSFDTPVDGVCIYYGRDRGELGQEPQNHKTAEKTEEYNYLFDDGKWSLL